MTAFEVITIIFDELTRSDAIGEAPARWHYYAANQMAHILLGATLALFRASVPQLVAVFGCWIAKELLGDIPNAGSTWLVMADSAADLCFGALGYIIAKKQMETFRNDQS